MKKKTHISLFVNTLSLYFFCKNYFVHNSCQFPQHVKQARGRVSWRGAGLFKWLNRCSELVWTDGAGHLLCRAEPEDEEKVRETADKTHHFHSNHRISTCLQSAPSVRRQCISVSNRRFVCSHVFLKMTFMGHDGRQLFTGHQRFWGQLVLLFLKRHSSLIYTWHEQKVYSDTGESMPIHWKNVNTARIRLRWVLLKMPVF